MWRKYVPVSLERLMVKELFFERRRSRDGLTFRVSKSRKSIVVYRNGSMIGNLYISLMPKITIGCIEHEARIEVNPSMTLKKMGYADPYLQEILYEVCRVISFLYNNGVTEPQN